MEAGPLVSKAVHVIKTFNPALGTMDSHIRDTLGEFDDVRSRVAGHELRHELSVISRRSYLLGCWVHSCEPCRVPCSFAQSDRDKTFIQQVFYGCLRYNKVLKVRGS